MKRRGVRRTTVVVALGVMALTLPAGVFAKNPFNRPTHVEFTDFVITSSTGVDHPAVAGTTFTHCASEIETILDAHGTVARTVEGKAHKNIWLLNGARQSVFNLVWTKTKKKKRSFVTGIESNVADGLSDGLWSVKIVQGGKTIGPGASVTIAEDPAC